MKECYKTQMKDTRRNQ